MSDRAGASVRQGRCLDALLATDRQRDRVANRVRGMAALRYQMPDRCTRGSPERRTSVAIVPRCKGPPGFRCATSSLAFRSIPMQNDAELRSVRTRATGADRPAPGTRGASSSLRRNPWTPAQRRGSPESPDPRQAFRNSPVPGKHLGCGFDGRAPVAAPPAPSFQTGTIAHFPAVRELADFDFKVQPSIEERQVRELATSRWIAHGDAGLLLGPPLGAALSVSVFRMQVPVVSAAAARARAASPRPGRDAPRIHPTALVAHDTRIGPDVVIGQGALVGVATSLAPGVDIGRDAVIGAGVCVGPFCVVGAAATLSDGVRLEHGAVVMPRVRVGPATVVGAHSVVDSGSVVGSHCTFDPDCYVGENVRVGVDVCIASGATVGDGAVRHPLSERFLSYPPLTLGDGVRIGPAVAVAPGAAIGHGTHVDQGTVIGPSARLGSFVRVSSGVRVAPNAEVGDHSTLAPCCAVDGLVGRNCRLGRDVAVAAGARVVDGVQLNAGVRVRSDTPVSSGSLASLTTPSAPQVSHRASRRPRTVLGRVLAPLRVALRSIWPGS